MICPKGDPNREDGVVHLRLNPMTFIEFLMATGDDALARFLSHISTLDPVPRTCFYPLFEKLIAIA